jgi:deoxyribose-phosphate aldolase
MDSNDIARTIDHTLLRPEATMAEIDQLCTEAREFGFYSVCVLPYWVQRCGQNLQKSDVKICTVIGFPFGCNLTSVKAFEASAAIEAGADELDMVIHMAALKSEKWAVVEADIGAVTAAAGGRPVKLILETSLLNEAEKIRACELAEAAGARFVKTSTGFNQGGATLADIELMKKVVGTRLGIKASGGIRDFDAIKEFLAHGATRIGTSHGARLFKGQPAQPGAY